MRKHKGGTTYFSTVPGRAAHNKKKREILRPFASALGLDEAALLRSDPDKSPSQAAAQKIQAPLRGALVRTKKIQSEAALAQSTLKSKVGIRASKKIQGFLAGKKRKSKKSKKVKSKKLNKNNK